MTLETLSSNELPTCLVYDTISATPLQYHHHHHHQHLEPSSSHDAFVFGNALLSPAALGAGVAPSADARPDGAGAAAGQARRKRRRRQRSCKNKEEAESQRMTHIAVERNRRRLMNEHLNVLRSLMPESYIQRGDQASIVGGAIDFVKELEQLLQSLEVQKRTLHGQREQPVKSEGTLSGDRSNNYASRHQDHECDHPHKQQLHEQLQLQLHAPPFAQFFAYPQYVWRHAPRDYSQLPPSESHSAVADIEVTLTETHANVRVLTPRRPRQLLSMVAGLQSLRLSILHLNVTTLDSMVLYSLSIKVEEGSNLTTVDDIAAAVHHMLALIEADMTGLTQ